MEQIKLFKAKVLRLGFWNDFKELSYISIPLILIALIQISLQITSIVFCGHLGTAQLDGVSLANSLINIIVFVSIEGLGTACDTLFPQLFGSDKKKIGIVLQKAILISILSMLISASLLLNATNLLVWVAKDKEVAVYANEFMVFFLPSVITFNFIAILAKYIQSQNIIYPLMVINFIVVFINIALHWFFIFGLELGVATKGWSIECLYDWKMYLKLAIPGLLSILIEWSNVEVGSLAAAALDEIELAVMAIGQQVMFIAFQIPYAIAIAANIRVGQFLGANKPEEAINAAKVTYFLTAIDIFVCFFVIYFGAGIIPTFFDKTEEVRSRSIPFLQLIAVIHIIDALQGTSSGLIRAVGGQFYASIISVIGYYVIGSPVGLCLMFLTDSKIFGFMYGNILGFIVINILQLAYFTRLNWVKVAEEAHSMSLEEAKEMTSVSNPNFEDKFRTESFRMESSNDLITPDDNEKKPITASHKSQIRLRIIVFVICAIALVISIFTHNLTNLDMMTSSETLNSTDLPNTTNPNRMFFLNFF